MLKTTCKNCGIEHKSFYKFCPECGQKINENLTLGVLFSNTISNYFSVDARFFKSFLPLMFKPGFLAQKFVEGKRLTYLHPAQFYLFVSVVFFFIFSFYIRETRTNIDEAVEKELLVEKQKEHVENTIQVMDSVITDSMTDKKRNAAVNRQENGTFLGTTYSYNEAKVDSLLNAGVSNEVIYKFMGMPDDAGFLKRKFFEQMLKFQKEKGVGSIFQTFTDTFPIAMFFLLPIFALLLKLFYFKTGKFANHLVFSFYLFSFLFILMSIVLGVNRLYDMSDTVDTLLFFSTYIYFFIAVKRFYRQGWFRSFFKSSLISFLFFIISIFTSFLLVLFSFMYY